MTIRLTAEDTAKYLKEHDDILIFTHKNADGDTCGSAAALCLALRKAGKRAYVHKNSKSTPRFEAMMKKFEPSGDFIPKFFVAVDMADKNRFYSEIEAYADKVDLCIDHHASNSGYAKRTFLKPHAAACGELIAELCDAMNVAPDKEIAQMIYIAISTDTGCFKFSSTTSNTLRIAAQCYDAGADIASINKLFFDTKTRERVKLESYVYENMRFLADGRLAVISVPYEIKSGIGASDDDSDGIAGLPVQINGVKLALTMSETSDGKLKMSARSAGDINACDFCRIFGGGGHKAAAGAFLTEFSSGCIERIIRQAEEFLSNV